MGWEIFEPLQRQPADPEHGLGRKRPDRNTDVRGILGACQTRHEPQEVIATLLLKLE